jgi:hypothetical protein
MDLIADKNQLTEMVNKSPLLSQENRTMILGRMGAMGEQEVGKLINIFLMEKQKMLKIEMAFDGEEMALKTEYLNTLTDFEHAGIHHALQVTEEREEANKSKDLEALLKDPEVAKKSGFVRNMFFSLAIIALAGAVYYFFFYAKTP